MEGSEARILIRTTRHPTQEDERNELEEKPGHVIIDVKQDEMLVAEGVDGTKNKRRHQRTKKGPPQGLEMKDGKQCELHVNTSELNKVISLKKKTSKTHPCIVDS